ncbi:MAG: penicillin-binding transpeptidase domain-containing protein [Planctomycetota bacterium]|nr:penicillin-binding transpeptidase domain-containing protein [Planctomycetota bacterium]
MVRRRLRLLAVLLLLPFGVVVVRLWSIQGDVSAHVRYVLRDLEQNTLKIAVAPRRGRIVDRRGAVLAESRAEFRLDFLYPELQRDRRGRVARAVHQEISRHQAGFPRVEEVESRMRGLVDLGNHVDPRTDGEEEFVTLVHDVPEKAARALQRRLQGQRAFEVFWPPGGSAPLLRFRPREAFRFELTLRRLARLLGPEVTPLDLEARIDDQLAGVERRVARYIRHYRAAGERSERRVRMTERTARQGELLHALPLALGVDLDVVTEIEYHPDDYRGIVVADVSRRVYPAAEATGAIVGYLRRLNQNDLTSLRSEGRLLRLSSTEGLEAFHLERRGTLSTEDLVGATGLEAQYDMRLRGVYGVRLVEKDRRGRLGEDLKRLVEVHGDDVVTTLDARLQSMLHEKLKERCRPLGPAKGGSVVVLELPSGAVRAAVGFPSFDPNRLRDAGYRAEQDRLWGDAGWELNRPLFQAVYPGSLFKIVTAIAALEDGRRWRGTLPRDAVYACDGEYPFSRWAHCHQQGGHYGNRLIDFHEAFQFSCNNFFYYMAHKHLEPQQLHDWARALGFGRHPGIDLPPSPDSESVTAAYARGSLTDPRREPRKVRGARICQYSIGQVHVLATPLQVVRAIGAVALRGRQLPTPYLVDPRPPEALPPIDEASMDVVWEGMRRAVAEPTGTSGKHGLGLFNVAAKTATAQYQTREKRYHAWIAGFGPLPEPRFAFAINLEESPEGGGKSCVPLAMDLLEYLARDTPELLE